MANGDAATLQAVLDSPDQDEPRLAYAQWCERQEDAVTQARGEFIRVQIDLANLTTDADFDRVYDLRQRSETLSDRHRRQWGQSVAGLVDDFGFDRGFVELAALPARRFLELAPRLFTLAPIRHLNLRDVKPVVHELFDSPHLKKIRSLKLSRCGLGDREISILAKSPHVEQLRWLSISDNQVGMTGAEAIAASPYLKRLAYANFHGNLVEPNEQYSYDNGLVVDSGLPKAGRELEARLGHLPWLHHEAKTIADSIPDRFRIRPAEKPSPA